MTTLTRSTWRTRAAAIIDEEGEASRLQLDDLAGLPFVAADYVDGQADPLYCSGIVVYWPGGHDHAYALADAIGTAERLAGDTADEDERWELWDDAGRMREALDDVSALVAATDELAGNLDDMHGEDGWTLAELAAALTDRLDDLAGPRSPRWRAHVERGFSKGPRVVVTFDL